MRFIETLREGERISGVYFCKHKTIAVAKSGKEYGNVILQDKTGTLDGKIWDLGSAGIREFESMDYVDIKGDVTVFNGALQLNIKEARKADEGTYIESDYMPTSQKNIEEMYAELTSIILSMKNEYLLKLTRRFFIDDKDFAAKFKRLLGRVSDGSKYRGFEVSELGSRPCGMDDTRGRYRILYQKLR